jgi:hypothetical protein
MVKTPLDFPEKKGERGGLKTFKYLKRAFPKGRLEGLI